MRRSGGNTIKSLVANFDVQPSASLQFVPYDVTRENRLPEALRDVLSFAEHKLQEVVILTKNILGDDTRTKIQLIADRQDKFYQLSPANQSVQERLKTLKIDDFQRSLSYGLRLDSQIADLFSQLWVSQMVLPLNAVTALIGTPVVTWVILRRNSQKSFPS